jgi:hypothetical protein
MDTHAYINTQDIRTLGVTSCNQFNSGRAATYVTPVSPCTNWATVNTSASTVTPSNILQIPGNANSTSNSQIVRLDCGQGGTAVMVRMRYPVGQAGAVSVRVIGFDGSYLYNNDRRISDTLADNVPPKPELLSDAAGNYTLTFTPDAATDPRDNASFAYTRPAKVDLHGNIHAIFLITSAGPANATIEARVI